MKEEYCSKFEELEHGWSKNTARSESASCLLDK